MRDTVTLRHGKFAAPKKIVYFYDGLLVAENGLLTIPANRRDWIKRSWNYGYNLTPKGERLWTYNQVISEIERQTSERAEEENENSDSRRQPASKNRVRKS